MKSGSNSEGSSGISAANSVFSSEGSLFSGCWPANPTMTPAAIASF